MVMATTIASYTMKDLETISVYGLASYVLFILGFLGIYSYELHMAKQRAQQVSSVINTVVRAFGIVIMFQLFVAFIFILVTAVVPNGETPAVGIDGFWHIDWLNSNIMSTINPAIKGELKELESAKAIVTLMAVVKIAYLVSLVMIFLITLSFAMSLPLEIMQKDHSTNGFAVGVQAFLSFASASLVFAVLMAFIGHMLGWVVEFSDTLGKTQNLAAKDIHLLDDLGYIFKIGVDQMTQVLSTLTPVKAE